MSDLLAPLRSNASSAPSSSRSVITAFQRAATMANFMPSAHRSPSTATGLPLIGSVHAQKLNPNPGSGSTVKMRDFQCVSVTGESRATASSPPCARQPSLGGLIHSVQRGHFHQHIGGRRKLAIHKFQVAQRRQNETPRLAGGVSNDRSPSLG